MDVIGSFKKKCSFNMFECMFSPCNVCLHSISLIDETKASYSKQLHDTSDNDGKDLESYQNSH